MVLGFATTAFLISLLLASALGGCPRPVKMIRDQYAFISRRGLAGDPGIELIARRRPFRLIERDRLPAIRKATDLSGENVCHLILAQGGHIALGRDHCNFIGRQALAGDEDAQSGDGGGN